MGDLKPYPEYKDSEVPSLGNIPAHWKMMRSGYLFREVIDTGHPDLELLSIDRFRGIIRQRDIGRKERASKDRSLYKRICKGQLGYNLMNAFMGSIGISQYEGIISPAYAVGQPQKEMNSWYYHYLYRTPIYAAEINRHSYGIMYERNRLYFDYFKRIPVPYPPIDEQNKIVLAIHQKSKEFQDLIIIKHRLIDLLSERKQEIISRAVTSGIDPNIRFKHSGIEWLGDVPEHWEIKKISHLFKKMGSGTTPDTSKREYYGGDIKWINTGDLNDSILSDCQKSVTKKAIEDFSVLCIYPKGSLIIALYGATIGKTCITDFDACTNQACCVLAKPDPEIKIKYLLNWFIAFRPQLIGMSYGGGQPNISQNTIRSLRVPVPPSVEQNEIVTTIETQCKLIEFTIEKTKREIDLIIEYRTHLISEIVTGKVNVLNIDINPPNLTIDNMNDPKAS